MLSGSPPSLIVSQKVVTERSTSSLPVSPTKRFQHRSRLDRRAQPDVQATDALLQRPQRALVHALQAVGDGGADGADDRAERAEERRHVLVVAVDLPVVDEGHDADGRDDDGRRHHAGARR